MEIDEQDRQWLEKNGFVKTEESKWALKKERLGITMRLEDCGWFALTEAEGRPIHKMGAGQTARKAFESLFYSMVYDAVHLLEKTYELDGLFDDGMMPAVERFMLSRKKSEYMSKLDRCRKAERPYYEGLLQKVSGRLDELKGA